MRIQTGEQYSGARPRRFIEGKPTVGLDQWSVSIYTDVVNTPIAITSAAPISSAASPARIKKVQTRSTNRRNAIVSAAWQLISERGYDDTSVNTIISELGISKGSFYHHFASKAAVIDAVVEMLTREVAQRVAADNLNASALVRLIAFIRAGREWHDEHTTVSTQITIVMLRPENTELLARITATERQVLRPLLEDIIDQGRTDNLFKVSSAALAADLLLPMLSDALVRIGREIIAGELAANRLIEQLKFLQYAVEQILGTPAGSLGGANPATQASRQQVQNFIDSLNSLSRQPSISPTTNPTTNPTTKKAGSR